MSMLFPEYSFIVPFLFVFALVYGSLSITRRKVSENRYENFLPKKVNIILAVVFGLGAAIYEPFSSLLMQVIPIFSLVLVFLFIIVFIKKLFETDGAQAQKDYLPIAVTTGILILITGMFWGEIAGMAGLRYSFSNDLAWILGIFFVIMFVFAGYKTAKSTQPHAK